MIMKLSLDVTKANNNDASKVTESVKTDDSDESQDVDTGDSEDASDGNDDDHETINQNKPDICSMESVLGIDTSSEQIRSQYLNCQVASRKW